MAKVGESACGFRRRRSRGAIIEVRRGESNGWECGLEFLTLRLERDRGVLVSTMA